MMDQETANHLFHTGAILLIIDLPSNLTLDFGIDLNAWKTGPKFKGLKLIPPGLHCIHYGVVNRHGGENTASRSGFFKEFKKGEIFVTRWDSELECMDIENPMDEQEANRYKSNIQEFDPYLGAYPLTTTSGEENTFQRWLQLSQYITWPLVNRLVSHGLFNTIESTSYHSDIQGTPTQHRLRIQFTEFHLKQSFPKDGSLSDITKYSIDKSYLLKSLLSDHGSMEQRLYLLLGEMQIAFILFLLGHIYDGFEQWKHLFILFCSSEECMQENASFFGSFLDVVEKELTECSADVFYEILGKRSNFVETMLSLFVQNVHAHQPTKICTGNALPYYTLLEKCEKLCQFVNDKFGWNVSSETVDDDVEGNEGFGQFETLNRQETELE